jgi:hypothetical protein
VVRLLNNYNYIGLSNDPAATPSDTVVALEKASYSASPGQSHALNNNSISAWSKLWRLNSCYANHFLVCDHWTGAFWFG